VKGIERRRRRRVGLPAPKAAVNKPEKPSTDAEKSQLEKEIIFFSPILFQ
jgi:hypothetical protein